MARKPWLATDLEDWNLDTKYIGPTSLGPLLLRDHQQFSLISEDVSYQCYQRGGYCRSLGNVEAMYWQERLTHSAFSDHGS
jgi:hypothetical protein